jgi:septum formation inhibitor MinC
VDVVVFGPVKRVAKSPTVQVTGRGSDVAFVIDGETPFERVAEDLRAYLLANDGMFSKGSISVDAGRRVGSPEELAAIRRIIETHSGLTVTRFWCSADSLGTGALNWEAEPSKAKLWEANPWEADPPLEHSDLPAFLQPPASETVATALPPSAPAKKALRDTVNDRSRNRSRALLIRSTFRSGESVRHDGDVVVLADVNPGAEIQADGDIVVFGCLKGLAHAGASGDSGTAIIALEIASPRIKIGEYEAEAGPASRRTGKAAAPGPKIAYVRRRSIQVAPFTGRFSTYIKGVPYDG